MALDFHTPKYFYYYCIASYKCTIPGQVS